ncbi:MAG: hypothetical protein RQ743_00510 [Bacteroidales bacterium]|nr:hypothetical protein [Bacteroidales bacterium]
MNELLKKVKDIYKDACVTIILNTHRTQPDNKKDPIVLKNLIGEAEKKLYRSYDKRLVWSVMEKINNAAGKIDHDKNLESLILFANQDFAEYTRLAVKVEDRVTVDNNFATRDLIRALRQESSYYVLVLSRQKARLIEAFNDKVVEEKGGVFPIEDYLYTTDKKKLDTNKGHDNLIEEFFNRVDKVVLETIKNNSLPLVIATEKRNYDHYLKIADKKDLIIGYISRNRDDEPAHDIVNEAWKEVLEIIKDRNRDRINELHLARGHNKLLSEYNEIWEAITEGRGKTLFVRKGFYQPAFLKGDEIVLADKSEKHGEGVVDDIIDEMIEQNLSLGGDTVFLEGNEIEGFPNLALITRY